jgi:hypothetical protein
MKLRNTLYVFLAAASLAVMAYAKGHQPPNLPLTTNLESTDALGAVGDIQSDGLGSYLDGVDAITSFLTSNGYNGIVWGDWQFDALNSTTRKVSLSFANPIPVDQGGTAAPNPPFVIDNVVAHIEDKCTQISYDMLTMTAGQTFPCPAIVHFFSNNGAEYRIYMAPNWTQPATPETTFVQVTCNAVASDGCNDWFIDQIPVGQGGDAAGATGRLVYFPTRPIHNDDGNRGDYYFKFHFHLTRP